jgi:hypothetical protein
MELDVHSAQESGLYDQRAALRGMIQRAVPALGHRQATILREAFDAVYARAGIVDDDDSTWRRPAPTFGDIQAILDEWAQDDARKTQRAAIEGCLAAVQELFGHPIFGRSSHVSVEQMLTEPLRLDLSKLPDQVRFIATETLLRKLFRMLRLKGPIPVQPADDRERFRLFVLIDEAKILSLGGGERDRADNILNELITEARKFGLGMILASPDERSLQRGGSSERRHVACPQTDGHPRSAEERAKRLRGPGGSYPSRWPWRRLLPRPPLVPGAEDSGAPEGHEGQRGALTSLRHAKVSPSCDTGTNGPAPTRSQVAKAKAVTAWYLETYHGTDDDIGVVTMFTDPARVGHFAVPLAALEAEDPEALFRVARRYDDVSAQARRSDNARPSRDQRAGRRPTYERRYAPCLGRELRL